MAQSERKIHRKTRSQNDEGMYDYNSAHLHQASETLMRERNPKRKSICECAQSAKGSFSNRTFCKENGWLVLLLYVPSQQLWSLRDGQFT